MSARPNILLVVFDSLSARHLNEHLYDLPHIRQLISQSLNFTAAYTCSPEGSPARASLFTGLDMAAHGLWTDGVTLPKHEVPFPEVFAQNGYQSWLVGRRHLAGVSNWTTEHARPYEYHHFDWAHGPLHRSRQNAYLTWLQDTHPAQYAAIFPRQADPDDTEIPEEQRADISALPDTLSFNSWVGEQTCARITDAPFCGVVGFVVGQTMGATSSVTETLDLPALKQADAALGAILDGLPQNTTVVLTAGRGSVDSVEGHPLQEDAIHIPLVLRLGTGKTGRISDPVSTMDIAATLFDLAGIKAPVRLQGNALTLTHPRGWALSRLRVPDQPHQTALIMGQRKLIMTHGMTEDAQLYDLEADPSEAYNRAQDPDQQDNLEDMIDLMIDARVALEDRTEPRIAKF